MGPDFPVRRLEGEAGNIRTAGKLDADFCFLVCFQIVLSKPFSDLGGLDADHGIASGVVVDGAAEHLRADHPLPEAIYFTRQRMFYDEAKKILSSFAS